MKAGLLPDGENVKRVLSSTIIGMQLSLSERPICLKAQFPNRTIFLKRSISN